MTRTPLHNVLDHLRRLHRVGDAAQGSDRQLLHDFVNTNDPDAFGAVVARHAPLVWGVCRRILRQHQDAEDAFQATFLILARRAASTRWRASVGGWLHTVARRVAVRARKQAEQRRTVEAEAKRTTPVDGSLRELAAVMDEELQRLPAKYREPLLLHYLQGATAEAAARQLGLRRSTFYNRLAYGRELLRQRLNRQGLALAAPLLAAALAPEVDAASRSLIEATIRVVTGTIPKRVAALAESLVAPIYLRLKGGLALGLLLGVAAGGVALFTPEAPMAPPPQVERPANSPKSEEKAALRVDRSGDPLPPGAITRLGTLRFRTESAGYIFELAFAPEGKTLAVASFLGLWIFDADTGKQTKFIHPRDWSFSQIALSPDGKRLLAAVGGRKPIRVKNGIIFKTGVQIWDVTGGRKTTEVELKDIRSLGWTAEGQPLVACQDKDAINLHEITTGRKRRFSAKDLSGPISSFCAIGKNVLAATGNQTGVIHVWDRISGKEQWALQTAGVFASFHSLVMSADERWLASLTHDAADKRIVQLWNLVTGKATRLRAADQPVPQAIVFAPDGKTLATVSETDVLFWDTASGRERGRLKEKRSFSIHAFAFSPDSKTLAIPDSLCGAIHLWDVATGKMKPEADGHSTNWIRTPTFSPDGKRVTTSGGLDGTIRIWDAATGRQLALLRRSPSTVLECAISADGRTLVSCWDDRVLLADAATGRERHVLETNDWRRGNGNGGAYMSMHVSSEGRKAIVLRHVSGGPYSGGGGGAGGPRGGSENNWLITGWDTVTRKQLFRRRFTYQNSHQYLAISADANLLAVPATKREPMHLENLETGELLLDFPIRKGRNIPLLFSPDRRLLLSETYPPAPDGSKRTLCVWEALTARELLALPISVNLSATAAFSPDGRLLATIAPENEILLWDLKKAKELHRFKDYDSSVTSLTFSPDSRRLVSGLSNSTLLVWDVPLPEKAPATKLDSEGVAKAWADLAGRDAARAFRARWALGSAPQEAVPFLKKHLHPAQAADPQRLRRLLADLESEQFAEREKAQEELQKLGSLAEPALRQTLTNKPTLEVRRHVQAVLERLRGPVTRPELLQFLRAVAVLEDIGTPEARRLLERLAHGAAEARLTCDAKASLQRLNRRSIRK